MKLFLISGFLGSGKTTAIKEACTLLLNNNTKVAVVTIDLGTVHLKELVEDAINTIASQTNSKIAIKTLSSFQPGYPNPSYRMTE